MSTKRNDSMGYKRGARGIDGSDHEGFETRHIDKSAMDAMYGRQWSMDTGHGKGDITSPGNVRGPKGASAKQLSKNAVGGSRKIGG